MVKADLKLHAVIYECANCGELKIAEDETPIAILKLTHVQPSKENPSDYDMVYLPVMMDPTCFKELELPDKPTEPQPAPVEIIKK